MPDPARQAAGRLIGMTRGQLNLLGAAACASMMGFALFAQHGLGLEPCPLCVFQRVGVIALGLVFLGAAAHRAGRIGSRLWGILLLFVAGLGGSVSARQVWLQNLPPDQVPACGPGLDYMFEVFPLTEALSMVFAGSGECAEIVWQFLGISMPGWVLICVASLGLMGLIANWRLAGR
jgi:disulfide bond formation protein DsbB